jgi:hypothetical protein
MSQVQTPPAQQHIDVDQYSEASTDARSPDQVKEDNELADRLSSIIEDANSRVVPLCQMMRKVGLHILHSYQFHY